MRQDRVGRDCRALINHDDFREPKRVSPRLTNINAFLIAALSSTDIAGRDQYSSLALPGAGWGSRIDVHYRASRSSPTARLIFFARLKLGPGLRWAALQNVFHPLELWMIIEKFRGVERPATS